MQNEETFTEVVIHPINVSPQIYTINSLVFLALYRADNK